jgi:putative glutathione S-transferase
MAATNGLPPSWHTGPDDGFHGKITEDGPFKPEKGRYHLYIGLFCPFAHRANFVLHLKQLDKYAGIETSIVKPYPKGDDKGWPGWQFNVRGDSDAWYEGATEDKLFGSKYMHELYFKADKDYKGRYSVPVLWDKKLNTIVNNESLELLRDLQTAFNSLLPKELADITLYPESLRDDVDRIGEWMQRDFNTGVYKGKSVSMLFPIILTQSQLALLLISKRMRRTCLLSSPLSTN